MNILEMNHVSKTFGSSRVLSDIHLSVGEGEIHALLGENGAGKSTTISILCGQLAKDAGTVFVCGEDVEKGTEKICRKLGVVFQNYALIPHMTVFNNIAYGLKIRKVPKEQIREKVRILSDAMHKSVAVLPGGSELRISISGGMAWYPEDSRDMETLKKYADFALYQVKHSHKGCLQEFSMDSYRREAQTAQLRRDFQQLLTEERVYYMFQPIFSAYDGRVMAYEALMRSDMERLRSPATIMKLAREQGALQEIERLTFFKSLETFDHLRSEGLVRRDALLFINSIASIALPREDSEYMDSRWHELRRQMVIEITEEEAIDREAMETKRHAPGFSGMFALDDYGSGYSNEGSLLELSPRFIKVDLTIIRGIDTDPDKQQIVQNIVAYAHPRSMQIIAEGVETAEELKKVLELGVDGLQGYFLAKPANIPTRIAPAARQIIENSHSSDCG